MKSNKSILTATALTLLTATSLFAAPAQRDQRGNRGSQNTQQQRSESRSYRENDRVNERGRVTSMQRERDGYRVQLDNRRNSYWIPASRMRNRGNDLRVGVSIVLGGVFRGGRIDVDNIGWPDDRGYRDTYVRGTVERVDYRSDVLILRDADSRRTIEVDMRDARRNNLRRGDYVELSGDWSRNGLFIANHIEFVR